jgi:hypothetical protein
MENVQTILTQEEQLQRQLIELNEKKAQALENERNEQLLFIERLKNDATGYRTQAEKAITDDEKRKLYKFADESDRNANDMLRSLGLLTEEQEQNEEQRKYEAKQSTFRKINSLLFKAVGTLLLFFISDFSSAKLDAGFLSYVLRYVSQILFFIATGFGGVWLVCILLFLFVSDYVSNELERDFRDLKPSHKFAILLGLFIAILTFLNTVIPRIV